MHALGFTIVCIDWPFRIVNAASIRNEDLYQTVFGAFLPREQRDPVQAHSVEMLLAMNSSLTLHRGLSLTCPALAFETSCSGSWHPEPQTQIGGPPGSPFCSF